MISSQATMGVAEAAAESSAEVPRWPDRLIGYCRALVEDTPRFRVVQVATLLTTCLYADAKQVLVPLLAAGILWQRLARRPAFWFGIVLGIALQISSYWHRMDNHQWLIGYWCLALGFAMASSDAEATAARAARLLIGTCFAVATFWKIASPDFLSGAFFRVALLDDPRFGPVARLAAGLDQGVIAAFRTVAERATDGPVPGAAVALVDSARLAACARFLALWTLVIEGSIALTFLWPEGRGPSRLRHWTLLAFVASTYPIASVTGFGSVLLAMGLAQAGNATLRVRVLYVALLVLLPVVDNVFLAVTGLF